MTTTAATQVIHLEADDNITAVRARLEKAETSRVLLVVPARCQAFDSLLDFKLLQQPNDLADISVHPGNHCRMYLLVLFPIPVSVFTQIRNLKFCVRDRIRQVKKERVFFIFLYKPKRFFRQQIMRVLLLFAVGVPGEHDLLCISPEMIRIIAMGLSLTVIPIPVIKALIIGIAF